MKYDVLIVGGGPAGAMAALRLIGSGLRVAILDRARFPRLKPCGGGISYRAWRRFPAAAHVFDSVPRNLVHRLSFVAPSGAAVDFESEPPLYAMIRRIEFDHALVEHCRQNGIEVREGVSILDLRVAADGVTLTSTHGEQFQAELVIGADGVNSTVAQRAGLRGPWPTAALAVDSTEESPDSAVSGRKDTVYIYYGIDGGYGYGYLFPKAEHFNFGVGYSLDYFRRNISAKNSYAEHLRFTERLRALGVFQGQSQKENFRTYVLPIAGPLQRLSTDRVLLAGDAAGFVNSFTAEGIYYAMVSGEHAGSAALAAVKQKDTSASFLRRHDRACAAELGSELRHSLSLQKRMLAHPRLIESVARFANSNSTTRSLIGRYGVGEISYEQMKRQALLRALPAFLRYKAAKLVHRLGAVS